jgi:hypothetical protein
MLDEVAVMRRMRCFSRSQEDALSAHALRLFDAVVQVARHELGDIAGDEDGRGGGRRHGCGSLPTPRTDKIRALDGEHPGRQFPSRRWVAHAGCKRKGVLRWHM